MRSRRGTASLGREGGPEIHSDGLMASAKGKVKERINEILLSPKKGGSFESHRGLGHVFRQGRGEPASGGRYKIASKMKYTECGGDSSRGGKGTKWPCSLPP